MKFAGFVRTPGADYSFEYNALVGIQKHLRATASLRGIPRIVRPIGMPARREKVGQRARPHPRRRGGPQ